MLSAVARRLLASVTTLGLVTVVVFAILAGLPGRDAIESDEQHALPPEYRAALREQFHLDDPLPLRYARWMADIARGDFGTSAVDRRSVASLVRERAGISVGLNALALAATLALAVPLGLLAAWRPGSAWDRWGLATTTAFYAVPVFWAGLVLQWVFAVKLGWLPLYGTRSDAPPSWIGGALLDRAWHMALPVVCMSYGGLAYVSRFIRTALVESTPGEGGRAARARGVSALRFVAVHGMRQASVPLLTLAGFLLPRLLGGSLLVEQIFNLPGLGMLTLDAVLARDVPVVMALTLLAGVSTIAAIAASDLLAAWADPRVRRGR